MIKWLKKNYIYILLFSLFMIIFLIVNFGNNYGDPFANYGFSFGITKGEVPYRDFNTISTPLYAFVMSIGLFIWNNYLMFVIEHCILLTIMYYFLIKLYGKRSLLLLIPMCMTNFNGLNLTYNTMTIIMFVIIMYLEEYHKEKDYLIGFFIALAVLSKHTVGAFFIIPSIIYYRKDLKKILRRFIGLIIPGIIFILYLLITNSIKQFFDLCCFGLFDFSSSNSHPYTVWFYLIIVLFIINIIIVIKRKDIKDIYILITVLFSIPIFDFHHLSIYLFCFSMLLLPYLEKYDHITKYMPAATVVAYIIFCILIDLSLYNMVFSKEIDRFQYLFHNKFSYERSLEVFKLFDKYYDDAVILSYSKMQYDISRNHEIDYFDVLLYGNYGYNGSQKMIERVKKLDKKYALMDRYNYYDDNDYAQFDKVVGDYVAKNYKLIERKGQIDIYIKE